MDGLLEIIWFVFSAIFRLARKATLATVRDESRPRWFNYCLIVCYYALPVMVIVSVFISWKLTLAVAGAFVVSLMAGAVTETDDIGAR